MESQEQYGRYGAFEDLGATLSHPDPKFRRASTTGKWAVTDI